VGSLEDTGRDLEGTDGMIVLCADEDAPRAWLRAGEGLSALWLHAVRQGLSVVPLSQVVEVAETRAALRHEVAVSTGNHEQALVVPCKPSGPGSGVSGGELLMLALATCYCNDLYREAARLALSIESVEVEASAEFPGIGLAATNVSYRAKVSSSAAPDRIAELLRVTDAVAEIHNTVRAGVPVTLEQA